MAHTTLGMELLELEAVTFEVDEITDPSADMAASSSSCSCSSCSSCSTSSCCSCSTSTSSCG
ncbi:thiazolylpeptide-type bacteriocin precursor [Haloactinopolyspora alba]|uniref:Thiazolylpeptide-type bacteriocin n=1 Tax=Haloactinopolyspora alba TaxID=648780 RepID=A0A2P8DWM4_9ACTN|nr:thiazolylpeptide-type bacteriocin [Haloactinopolyspora alba]PSL01625.1 thiazolylpeptide-type bacteriocin precursor [Haloactinopolyspora alba]